MQEVIDTGESPKCGFKVSFSSTATQDGNHHVSPFRRELAPWSQRVFLGSKARRFPRQFQILSMELLHAAQAADLRLKEHAERKLATATKSFHDAFRQKVPFLDHDRSMPPDIAAGSVFLKEYALTN
ncbi:hypothetical protein OE766_24365 [Pararhizobium sp. YC-54]|uniref:hypothetical protein n=1 Tax=Pararhizobium sp. YC-54 TaxID=2986920 RepID=UPI0021F773B9|nr:hypothetical protein [Pararhizobium sp. YC-54]MCW0001360.1 hypothetical protein [Pararhizobium sp. YC-54]